MSFIKSEKFPKIMEMIVAILMGLTAVLIAYASWQSSLYGGNQATKYARGTALVGEGNSMYTEASQSIAQDMAIWNRIVDLRIDTEFAQTNGNEPEAERFSYKLNQTMADNVNENLAVAIEWADAQADYASPFDKEGFMEGYYEDAQAKYQEGEDMILSGQKDNSLGDMLGLVTVIFSVGLFLLGIALTFKNDATKLVVAIVSFAALIYGSIVMLGIPMLTV